MTIATRYKASIITVFVVGAMAILGITSAFVLGTPKCNDRAMKPADTCILQEDGKKVEYTYEDRSGHQAGQAVFYALAGLGVLTALCIYLYPRSKKAAPVQVAPGVTNKK